MFNLYAATMSQVDDDRRGAKPEPIKVPTVSDKFLTYVLSLACPQAGNPAQAITFGTGSSSLTRKV